MEHSKIRLERNVDSSQNDLPHQRRRAPAERTTRDRRRPRAVAVYRRREVEIRVHLRDLASDVAGEVLVGGWGIRRVNPRLDMTRGTSLDRIVGGDCCLLPRCSTHRAEGGGGGQC